MPLPDLNRHFGVVVEPRGIEPLTYTLRTYRSSQLSYDPMVGKIEEVPRRSVPESTNGCFGLLVFPIKW